MQFDLFHNKSLNKMSKWLRPALGVAALFLIVSSLSIQSMATVPVGFTETPIASGFSAPTSFAIHPDGRIFVCQQGGALRVVKNNTLLATPFTTVTTTSTGERGLLGVAFDPDYATNRYVYVYYTATSPTTHNRVSRFTADSANEDIAVPGSELILMDLENLSATNHNGGAIHFGPDGKLYIAVGDNANTSNPQSLSNRLGKILRINTDGTFPLDNPTTFPGIVGSPTGVNQSIWAVGFRNPFTFAFQPGTGLMYINDVGQVTTEEVNNGIAGSNYGWPTCEGTFVAGSQSTPCGNSNFADPVYQFSSASGASECTVIGGAFYNPTTEVFPASYVGKYFFADYCAGWIRYVDPLNPSTMGNASPFASGLQFGTVDIHVSNDGSMYYLSRRAGTPLVRIQYVGTTPTNTPTPTATATATATNTPTNTPTPTATATPADSIAGTVTYVNASSSPVFVSNVVITGEGSSGVSSTTAAPGPIAGTYLLTGFGSGSYTVTPTKVGGVNGITSFDAGRIAQHVAGMLPLLNANQQIAADTSGNNNVTSFDAGQLAQWVVSGTGGNTANWRFLPASRTYEAVAGTITGEDYSAILVGEVSGNWINSGARPAVGSGPERSSTVNAPRLITKSGDEIVVPVDVQGIANKGIIAYEFELRYDPAAIQPTKNAVDVAGTVSRGLTAVYNAEEPGLLRVAVYGPMPIVNGGILLNLRFTAVGTAGMVSPLIWERLMLNEGSPYVVTNDGQIELF